VKDGWEFFGTLARHGWGNHMLPYIETCEFGWLGWFMTLATVAEFFQA
jgi:hypothetical protein